MHTCLSASTEWLDFINFSTFFGALCFHLHLSLSTTHQLFIWLSDLYEREKMGFSVFTIIFATVLTFSLLFNNSILTTLFRCTPVPQSLSSAVLNAIMWFKHESHFLLGPSYRDQSWDTLVSLSIFINKSIMRIQRRLGTFGTLHHVITGGIELLH